MRTRNVMTDKEKTLAVELPTLLILNLDLFTDNQLSRLISSMEVELRERDEYRTENGN